MLELIRDRIRTGGPMSFATFMRAALYEPGLGYYRRNIPGPDSDYRTSPSLTPWFGRLVARAIERMWRALGEPADFIVAEMGPGGAELAEAAAGVMPQELLDATTWCLVEPFVNIAETQREVLKETPIRTRWAGTLDDMEPFTGCILANEVLDNFPVHVFEIKAGKAQEIMVGLDGDRLGTVLTEIRDPALLLRTMEPAAYLEEGDRFEVCMHYDQWARSAGNVLRRGYLTIIDYGDKEPELWQLRPSGTLVTYYRQMLGVDPLENPGDTDITAHVNFSSLARSVESAGLMPHPMQRQREFLESVGLKEAVHELREIERDLAGRGAHDRALGVTAERGRIEALAARGGLGDLNVFIATRDAPYPP